MIFSNFISFLSLTFKGKTLFLSSLKFLLFEGRYIYHSGILSHYVKHMEEGEVIP